jgi:phosphohistidine phosphatase
VKIYVMRHGPAEDHASTGRDFDRKLTSSGRTRTELVAQELGKRDEYPKRILSSPLRRTVETAAIVIATMRLELELERREELAPGGQALDLVRSLAREGARRVMLVGHEPDVSRLTAHLWPSWSRGFDKSMVVVLKLDRDALTGTPKSGAIAEVRFVVEPKRLDN